MATNGKWRDLVRRSGLRVSFCGYCGQVCLAAKRSLCCGDAVYDDDPSVAKFLGDLSESAHLSVIDCAEDVIARGMDRDDMAIQIARKLADAGLLIDEDVEP